MGKLNARVLSRNSLWQIEITCLSSGEDAVSTLLENLFKARTSIYSGAETTNSIVTVFTEKKPSLTTTRHLKRKLADLAEYGIDVGAAKISIRKVRKEDWAESWKKYFHVLDIDSRLLIKPSWSRRRPKPDQAVVILDPGLSFGTGQHPTTAFCLKQIVRLRKRGLNQGFLDIGTGSGILAIAAAKLGYAPARGFDNDPVAIRVACQNLRRNRVQNRVTMTRRDLARMSAAGSAKYDLVCANLISDLLIREKERIIRLLKPGGTLVLAGILQREFASVQDAYAASGFELKRSRIEREWQSGAFRQKILE